LAFFLFLFFLPSPPETAINDSGLILHLKVNYISADSPTAAEKQKMYAGHEELCKYLAT